MKNFCKLNLPEIPLNFTHGRLINSHIGRTAKLSYFELDKETTTILSNAVKIPPVRICYAEIVGEGTLGAHIDYGAKTALNYYIESCNATTNFFDAKRFINKNLFSPDEIMLSESFIANNNEYYLLDVSRIHNIEFSKYGKRSFITWQWMTSYNLILNSFT